MVLPVDQAFLPASTVVLRDIYRGKVWSAWPCRALSDTGDLLTLAFWPGVTGLAPMTFIESMRSGNAAIDRARSVDAHAIL